MIISDLNYLEAVSQETEVVGGYFYSPGFSFYKNVNANVNTSTNFNSSTYVNDYFNKSANVNANSNVNGNSSSIAFDNEAQGPDTHTQTTLNQLTVAGQYSGQNGTLVSASNY